MSEMERQLTLRGEGRLGLVQHVDALLEAVDEQRQERLAMRLRVQRRPAIAVLRAHLVDI